MLVIPQTNEFYGAPHYNVRFPTNPKLLLLDALNRASRHELKAPIRIVESASGTMLGFQTSGAPGLTYECPGGQFAAGQKAKKRLAWIYLAPLSVQYVIKMVHRLDCLHCKIACPIRSLLLCRSVVGQSYRQLGSYCGEAERRVVRLGMAGTDWPSPNLTWRM